MIELEPMSADAFQRYLERAVDEYAEEHVRGGRWSPDEAIEQSRKEYQDLLPNGVDTPNHFLFTLVDSASQTPVGILWYALQSSAGRQSAFIYDITIDPAFRRQGYATQAFLALEQRVRAQGVHQIRLHVFGHNHQARALYEKLGYVATNVMMSKTLDQ